MGRNKSPLSQFRKDCDKSFELLPCATYANLIQQGIANFNQKDAVLRLLLPAFQKDKELFPLVARVLMDDLELIVRQFRKPFPDDEELADFVISELYNLCGTFNIASYPNYIAQSILKSITRRCRVFIRHWRKGSNKFDSYQLTPITTSIIELRREKVLGAIELDLVNNVLVKKTTTMKEWAKAGGLSYITARRIKGRAHKKVRAFLKK